MLYDDLRTFLTDKLTVPVTRIYPLVLEGDTLPAITMRQSDLDEADALTPSGVNTISVELAVYSTLLSEVITISEELRTALNGYKGDVGSMTGCIVKRKGVHDQVYRAEEDEVIFYRTSTFAIRTRQAVS